MSPNVFIYPEHKHHGSQRESAKLPSRTGLTVRILISFAMSCTDHLHRFSEARNGSEDNVPQDGLYVCTSNICPNYFHVFKLIANSKNRSLLVAGPNIIFPKGGDFEKHRNKWDFHDLD